MFQQIREALINKLDEQRESELYCTIQWSDTKDYDIIPQRYIRLPAEQEPEIHANYYIVIDNQKRLATVLGAGTRKDCETILHKWGSKKLHGQAKIVHGDVGIGNSSDIIDDLILMRILGKLLNQNESIDENNEDIHDAQCASCQMKPIRQVDRYHCLECSKSKKSYDLCGRCFEKRCETDTHFTGHAMAHFKMPNELLGIQFNNINQDVTLDKLKQMSTFRNEKHDGIKCDGECHQISIVGLRFKCDSCPNHNLCETCGIIKRICTKSHKRDHPLILTSERVIPKIDPDDIELGEVFGRGGFGFVCMATWKSKRRQVACKVIEVSSGSALSNQLRRSFLAELAAYRELSGPYILRTFGYATRHLPETRIRGSTIQYWIIMELMGRGSLQNLLEKEPNQLSLRRKVAMARQIASGMRRIHQHGMIHRDIRPDNVLVTDDYIAKIGDMGIARVLDAQGQQTQIGCKEFMPPEYFRDASNGYTKCDEKLDIYTYGLTINQLFTETMHDFALDGLTPNIKFKKESPIFYEDIILKCIDHDSKQRPTAIEIEKNLEFYEQAFMETMQSDAYTRMNIKERDRVFIEFYLKNRHRMQRLIKEQLRQNLIQGHPVDLSHGEEEFSRVNSTNNEAKDEPCRIS